MIESASIFAKKCESSRIEAFRSLEADGWLTPRRGNSPSGRLIRHITQLNTAYFADGRQPSFWQGQLTTCSGPRSTRFWSPKDPSGMPVQELVQVSWYRECRSGLRWLPLFYKRPRDL